MKRFLTIVILAFFLGSCAKKDNGAAGKPVDTIVGTWQEEETDVAFAGTTYHYIFDSNGRFRL